MPCTTIVSRWDGSNPGSTLSTRARLRVTSPAPTSSMNASAICATTSPPVTVREVTEREATGRISSPRPIESQPETRATIQATPAVRPSADEHHPPVEPDRARAGQVRVHRHHGVHAPPRQEQSGAASDQAEERVLEPELLQQASAAGAERGAEHQLGLPLDRARQHEVSDVGARDQQHEPRGAEHQQQRRTDLGHQLLVQPHRPHTRDRILRRVLAETIRAVMVPRSAWVWSSVASG